jgi:hypothetical protein
MLQSCSQLSLLSEVRCSRLETIARSKKGLGGETLLGFKAADVKVKVDNKKIGGKSGLAENQQS